MDYIYFKIDYKVPYEVEAVRTIADSLAQAVRDNWSDEVNKPEFSEPLPCDRLEAWLENAVPDRMERVPDELADEEEIERFTEHIGFRFSPFSSREAELSAYKNRDGSLGVGLSVSVHVLSWDTDPELGADASVHWPKNRACLLHIYNTLCGVFPVRSRSIDPGMTDD